MSEHPSSVRAIVLLAHGSRDPNWRTPIEAVAEEIRKRETGTKVVCAFIELCPPTLPEAATKMIAEGAGHIRVFPLFLGVGKHAREDLPLLVAKVRAEHPGVEIELLPTAGEYTAVSGLLAEIALS